MYKLIDSSSFFPNDEPSVQIIHPENINELVKVAADQRIHEFVKNLTPATDRMYLHINAMGAGEFYGSNKNGDYFPEENLKLYYTTFETSPAHVFRHHINKDPARAIGKVLYAIYNERMHRVELIAEVSKELGNDIENRISMGEYPSTSMACKTPFDVCSICSKKANTRQEYCTHLSNQLGQLLPDGRKVMALNVGPLKFFDISIVIRPADVTSSILQKVAFQGTISSIELAEEEDISDANEKQASFKKLSELIKTIEDGQIQSINPYLQKILAETKDPSHDLIKKIKDVPLDQVVKGMADLGISPSISFLAELIARKVLGKEGHGLGKLIEKYLNNTGANNIQLPKVEFKRDVEVSPQLSRILMEHVADCSLLPTFAEKRASAAVGYAFNGPHIELTEQEEKMVHLSPTPDTSFMKQLLQIGGAALLAKWYITSLIEERYNNRFKPQPVQNNVKIVLVKKASDYNVVYQLSKAAMEQVIIIKPAIAEKKREQATPAGMVQPIASTFVLKALSQSGARGEKIGAAVKAIKLAKKLNEGKNEYK